MKDAPNTDDPLKKPRRISSFGCGCGVVIALVLAVLIGISWYAYEKGKDFESSLRDPAARDARSREILGYEKLPAGYHPMGGFSIPFVMEMAMLSDRNPPPGEGVKGAEDAFRSHGFVFMRTRGGGKERRELNEFFSGARKTTDFFKETDLSFDVEERLGQGNFPLDPAKVRYVTERVSMGLGGEPHDEVLARLLIQCPGDERLRVALWFEPFPAEGELAGTPGDPEAIKAFLGHFDLCR